MLFNLVLNPIDVSGSNFLSRTRSRNLGAGVKSIPPFNTAPPSQPASEVPCVAVAQMGLQYLNDEVIDSPTFGPIAKAHFETTTQHVDVLKMGVVH